MANCRFDGLDELMGKFSKAGKDVRGWTRMAVYEGAGKAVDIIQNAYNSEHKVTGDLASSLGISKITSDGASSYNSISFDGVDRDGKPNIVKARSLESGNSKGEKAYHIFRRAANAAKTSTKAAIEESLSESIDKAFNK